MLPDCPPAHLYSPKLIDKVADVAILLMTVTIDLSVKDHPSRNAVLVEKHQPRGARTHAALVLSRENSP